MVIIDSLAQVLSKHSDSNQECHVHDVTKGILCLTVEIHTLSESDSVFLCWGLAPWTSKLPSRAPAAAPTADLVVNPVATLEEQAKAPTAAPSTAPPAVSHDGVQSASSCHTWLVVTLYGPRIRIRITVLVYWLHEIFSCIGSCDYLIFARGMCFRNVEPFLSLTHRKPTIDWCKMKLTRTDSNGGRTRVLAAA